MSDIRGRDLGTPPIADAAWADILTLNRQLGEVAADRDEWKSRALAAEDARLPLVALTPDVAAERQRAARIVRERLAFDNQRAVSWHEVQDAAEAIERGA